MIFKILFAMAIVCGLGVIFLLIKGIKDGKEPPSGTHIIYPDEEEINEDSPLNIEVDKTLKVLNLRKKMEKIKETPIDDINIDYQNYEGK